MDNYKYYIVDSTLTQTEVFPVNKGSQEFQYEKSDKSSIYFEKTLSGKLVFYNNIKEGIYDFNYFKSKEENDKCFELELKIHKKCGSTYSLFWEGVFSVLEGEFDNDKCIYEISPRLKYTIQSDLDVNMLDSYSGDGSYNVRTGNLSLGTERIYSNGRSLEYLLLYLAQQSSANVVGIISDFFQINPVNDIIYFDYYIKTDNYHNLILFPLSEIQEPVPSNRAVKEFISLDKLMDDLNVMFDVYWFIDENFNIRIEHKVFFNRLNGLDITGPEYQKYLVGTNKITYDLDDFPKYETWKILGSKEYCRISYLGCGNINKNKNEKIYSTNVINTNYSKIRNGSSSSDSNGLFMMACYQSLGLFHMHEGFDSQNYLLQTPQLVYRFKRYDRPSSNNEFEYYMENQDLQTIEINQGNYLPYSTIATKFQQEIKVPLCCGVEFDPSKKITTNLGVGFLESAKFSMKTNSLSLKLKYKSESYDPFITPKQINGCQLWLTADTGVVYTNVSGFDRVSQWQDQSGNGNHANQSTVGLRPFYDFTNKHLDCFSGLYLETSSFQMFPSKRGSVFYLAEPVNTGSLIGTSNMAILSTNTGNKFDVGVVITYTAGSPAYNTFLLASFNLSQNLPRNTLTGLVQINRESDTTQTMYSNGLKPSVLTGNPMTIPNLQVDASPLIIGKNASIGTLGPAIIKEVIVYDRVVTDLERQQIELYLMNKWNLTLYQEF